MSFFFLKCAKIDFGGHVRNLFLRISINKSSLFLPKTQLKGTTIAKNLAFTIFGAKLSAILVTLSVLVGKHCLRVIVPTFEENGIFMLGVVFLFSQFSPIEIITFNEKFLYPIEGIDFLSSNLKRY